MIQVSRGLGDQRHMHVDWVSDRMFWRALMTKGSHLGLSQEVTEIQKVSELCRVASGSFPGVHEGRPMCAIVSSESGFS